MKNSYLKVRNNKEKNRGYLHPGKSQYSFSIERKRVNPLFYKENMKKGMNSV
jgi:hypothetical protein